MTFPQRAAVDALSREAVTRAVVDSDARYFTAAAECARFDGFEFAHAHGLESLSAGCVAIRVSAAHAESDPRGLRLRIEEAARQAGAAYHRLYLTAPLAAFDAELRDHRYTARVERVLLRTPAAAPPALSLPQVRLREVRTQQDWALKARADAESAHGPDGYALDCASWSEFERRKWAAGSIGFFLAENAHEVCGTAGLLVEDGVFRLKNLLVRPAFRHHGVGAAIALALAGIGADAGCGIGAFAVAGGAGERLYQRVGYEVVGAVTEYIKKV